MVSLIWQDNNPSLSYPFCCKSLFPLILYSFARHRKRKGSFLLQAFFFQKQCFQSTILPTFRIVSKNFVVVVDFFKKVIKRKEKGFYSPFFRSCLKIWQKSEYPVCKIIASQKICLYFVLTQIIHQSYFDFFPCW